jgi:dipeptidyl aminopeptidase/acylaminoacyl peptidase
MLKEVKPYGYWNSPITAELVSQASKRFGNIVIEGDRIYWDEMRPAEGGRTLIVSEGEEITPEGISVRSRSCEYGGKAFTVSNNTIYFVNDKDQRVYVQKNSKISPLTEEHLRFADLCMSPEGLIAAMELPSQEMQLVLIDLTSGKYTTLASGFDFYASPALSPDGKKLAWLAWNLPNMPWDGTELWSAELKEKKLEHPQKVAGGDQISIFQPSWSKDGTLYYVSDKNGGWWNLYRFQSGQEEALHPMPAEFGLPQWVFGLSTYAFADNALLCTYFQNGVSKLALFDLKTKKLNDLPLPGTHFAQIRAGKDFAVFLQGSSTEPTSVVQLDLKTKKEKILAQSSLTHIDPAYFSIAQPITYPSAHGRLAHGFYYPPKNKDFEPPRGELPPLIVKTHGGPTAHATGTFDLKIQYWTSRGFAVLDVNYGGSTGYGRAYRELLKDNWGIVDVEDCVHGVQYLLQKGLIDPKRLAITGGSAGGYTTLAALTFTKTFTVGASYYGVSDLQALVKETHKFESRYLENLIGPYPQRIDLYKARSPLQFPEKICCPVIFFQGAEDKIVPPDQAEMMYAALKKRGIMTKLIIYPGEQHGFRKADNIKNSLEEELSFYLQAFKMEKTD